MTTVFHTSTSLDGFLADVDHDFSWVFDHKQEEASPLGFDDFVAQAGAMAMGANCYELLQQQVERGFAWPYSIPCWVFTHRELDSVPGADIRFAQGPVAAYGDALLESAGENDLWVFGGGELAVQFAQAELLDEIIVNIAPLTLGSGQPLFPEAFDLELLEAGKNGDFACARYRVRHQRL